MSQHASATGSRLARLAAGSVVVVALVGATVSAGPAEARLDQAARGNVQCGGAGPGTIKNNRISIQLFNFFVPILGAIALPPEFGGGFFPPGATPFPPSQWQPNVRSVFAALEADGYSTFESFGGTYNWTADEYRQVYKSYGLRAVAAHGDMNPATFDTRLQEAHDMGQKYVGSGGWPTGTNMNTVAGALNTAAVLNDLGRRAAFRHMTVYGHNHDAEFRTKLMYDVTGDGVPESVPALEVVARNIDPRYVSLEVDIHWAYEGLGHANFDQLLSFLRKYSDRIKQLHVKGTAASGAITDVGTPSDITDWKAVFRAAKNVDYYHFEYDLAPDPFASAANGFKFLDCIRF